MRRHRREYVAAVESCADRTPPILRVGESPGAATARNRRRTGLGSIPECRVITPANQRQQPVVGRHESGVGCFQQQSRPIGSHARIYHRNEDATGREIRGRVRQRHRAVSNVLRANSVGEVDHVGSGIDAQNDPPHHAHVGIGKAEIGGQDDRGRCHNIGGRFYRRRTVGPVLGEAGAEDRHHQENANQRNGNLK